MELVHIIIGGVIILIVFVIISYIVGRGANYAFDKMGEKADKGQPGCLVAVIIIVILALIAMGIYDWTH